MSIILSLDVSCGASRIRRAMNDVAGTCLLLARHASGAGMENVEVFEDTNRIVVTGWADVAELQTRLQSRLRRQVDIISSQEPRLQFSSDEEEEEEDQPANPLDWCSWNPTGEWYGMGLPAPRVREPQWSDNPVPDPAPWFFNLTLSDPTPRRDDGAGPSGT